MPTNGPHIPVNVALLGCVGEKQHHFSITKCKSQMGTRYETRQDSSLVNYCTVFSLYVL